MAAEPNNSAQASRFGPGKTPVNVNQIIADFQAGRLAEAEAAARIALRESPNNAVLLQVMGLIALQRNCLDEAVRWLEQALAAVPEDPALLSSLADAYHGSGHSTEAVGLYERAIGRRPDFFQAHNNLGLALMALDRHHDALVAFLRAQAIDPASLTAAQNVITVLLKLDRHREAEQALKALLKLTPADVEAYFKLGMVLEVQGKHEEALEPLRRILALQPDFAEAHYRLGVNLSELKRVEEAMDAFMRAVELKPDYADAYLHLGETFYHHGYLDEATTVFDRALTLQPELIRARWARCMAQLAILYPSQEAVVSRRRRYRASLLSLGEATRLKTPAEIKAAAEAVGSWQPFYLAYQGENDRELQTLYGELACRIMAARYPQWTVSPALPPRGEGEPIRVGIASGYFCFHTVWKLLIRGWSEQLDRRRFKLFGYHTGRLKDRYTYQARQAFAAFTEGPLTMEEWCRVIRADNLHVLIYPEIGMNPMAFILAALRLAPVQCVSWGHPETTGLPTMDYFLTSDLMEPAGGEAHYSERLVRLPNLSIYYTPFERPRVEASRATFGLKGNGPLYLCCQSLFKYLPRYDEVFPRIARDVPGCQFVFIANQSRMVTDRFRQRLEAAFARCGVPVGDCLQFVTQLSDLAYQGLNSVSDVYLDSIGWSGGNTTLEATDWDLPIVTLAGHMMRGRHTAAVLARMGLGASTAQDVDEYVAIAVRAGCDIEFRRSLAAVVARNKHRLYADTECIRALENFLEEAVSRCPKR